jgi:rubrerythrin
MKTSREWWSETKQDDAAMKRWLLSQYHGEVSAAVKIELLRDQFAARYEQAYRVLSLIAEQERLHAVWVLSLLRARDIEPATAHQDRYWSKTLPGITDLATGCAVGAHAEKMRLERIETIAADDEAPADIREVFQRILPQELFHERAFRALSTQEALSQTKTAHTEGRNALGLAP